ncbi:AAA family ATPase [Labrys sp. La1]|uniref:AAA family ATPase n=1 Tax=Labrys sp. La1 TaxID=3404917 RepID=UPI003EBD4166
MKKALRMKKAVLVNGVPASGKSSVARLVADARGWAILGLDTVKEPFFDHLGVGDRDYNRKLGRASSQAIWSIVGDAPDGMTFVVDAWFGFQPREVLEDYLARAGIGLTAEIWCHAPPDILVERYRARLSSRHAGHPGEAFLPELVALAQRAQPLRRGPLFDIDTAAGFDEAELLAWLDQVLDG